MKSLIDLYGMAPSPERMANVVRAARARKGFKHSEETKEKMRYAALQRRKQA